MIHRCSWCEARKPADERATGDVSHGICGACQLEQFVAVPLHSVVARLNSAEYLSAGARREIAQSTREAVRRLERFAIADLVAATCRMCATPECRVEIAEDGATWFMPGQQFRAGCPVLQAVLARGGDA